MQDVLDWLGKQIDANDPAKAGTQGAVRLTEAAAALSAPQEQAMAFGLVVEPAVLVHTRPLVERMKAMVGAHLATLDPDGREAMRRAVGSSLTRLGLGLAAPPPGVATHTVTLRYPLMSPAVVSFDTDDERDMTTEEKRCFDGVRPASGFDDIVDLPCFMELDWLLDARVVLRFAEGELFCEVALMADAAPSAADLDALKGAVSRNLWGSGWSMNLEWEDLEARAQAGIGDDSFTNLTVHETPERVTVSEGAAAPE